MKKTIITCDMCGSTNETVINKKIGVVMTTEQNEGRSCKPYYELKNMDICEHCLNRFISGEMIFGRGAMGYNSYTFKK